MEGREQCDGAELVGSTCQSLGFDEGDLGCGGDCNFDTAACVTFSCGDGAVQGIELCDGPDLAGESCETQGFLAGSLACAANCDGFDTTACALSVCGNVQVEGDEVCDGLALMGQSCVAQGFESGFLGCADDCTAFDTSGCGICNNGTVDGFEVCDAGDVGDATCLGLGFDSGSLGCAADCQTLDTSTCGICGNGQQDGTEVCDGNDGGNQTCVSLGFTSGEVSCSADCGAIDTSECGICGNATIDGSETCDGAELGGESCQSLIGFGNGALTCSPACGYNLASCGLGNPWGSDAFYTGFVLPPGDVLPCDNIADTGSPTNLSDDSAINVQLGFNFAFYGNTFSQITLASNGAAYFGNAGSQSFSNACIPANSTIDDNLIDVFWDDLNPSAAGDIFFQTFGVPGARRFVAQWETTFFSGGNNVDLLRIQTVLYEGSNVIQVCYTDTLSGAAGGNNGASATVGLQRNLQGGLQFSCNAPNLQSGTLLTYVPN